MKVKVLILDTVLSENITDCFVSPGLVGSEEACLPSPPSRALEERASKATEKQKYIAWEREQDREEIKKVMIISVQNCDIAMAI